MYPFLKQKGHEQGQSYAKKKLLKAQEIQSKILSGEYVLKSDITQTALQESSFKTTPIAVTNHPSCVSATCSEKVQSKVKEYLFEGIRSKNNTVAYAGKTTGHKE